MSKIDENQNLSDDLQDRTPVKTKKHNDGDAAVWVFTLIILAAFVLLIVWATKSSKVNVYGNMSVEENYRYGSDSKAQLTLTNGYAAQGKEIVWLVDDSEVSRVAYSADAKRGNRNEQREEYSKQLPRFSEPDKACYRLRYKRKSLHEKNQLEHEKVSVKRRNK